MRKLGFGLVALVFVGLAAAQDVRVVGVAGATIKDLVNTPTLVTVVLKGSGVQDANLRIVELQPEYFVFVSQDNVRDSYRYGEVEEIRIQGGKVEKEKYVLPQGNVLRGEDQKIIERVRARIREIYDGANENQDLKIKAALLLALIEQNDAKEYLQKLMDSNEIKTQLAAASAFYLTGGEVPEKLIRAGLDHGNRAVRAAAADLAGLTGYRDGIPLLNTMLQDRAAELCVPAARALARLGVRECIPKLLEMLTSLAGDKADAAVFALTRLGGPDIVEQLKVLLPRTEGNAHYRVVLVLYNLNDPDGRRLLLEIFNDQPTLKPDVALLLAKAGDWNGQQYLRERLNRRENASDPNLIYRAKNVASLIQGGDPSVLSRFQELLREGSLPVKKATLELIAQLGDRNLLSIMQASIENGNAAVALESCNAAMAIALPEYRARFVDVKNMQ